MFPYSMPVRVATMNYSCVIVGGLTVFQGVWYVVIRKRGYQGPRSMLVEAEQRLARGEAIVVGTGSIVGGEGGGRAGKEAL